MSGEWGVLRGPREVLFGVGQREAVGAVAARHGTSAFVVTDPRLAADPALGELVHHLSSSGMRVQVYDGTEPDVPVGLVAGCLEGARRHGTDVVVGFGGGSCLDLAKVVALLLAHGGRVRDYYGELQVPGPTVPVVAVPTTAGTGSEVTPVAVLNDPGRTSKVGISSPHLIPVAAICDPELTITSPAALTASAGADALSHCVEAFTAVRRPAERHTAVSRVFVGKGVLTDQWALLGIRCIAANLKRACTTPEDVQARSSMMLGALAGGYALGTAGTAAAHALQYPIGALTHTPHGVGVGALLPYVMAFNRMHRVAELAEVARAFGGSWSDVGDADEALSVAAVRAVAGLLRSVGVPGDLSALGVPEHRLPWAAAEAMTARRLVENNPRPLDVDAALQVLRAAFTGDLAAVDPELGAGPAGSATASALMAGEGTA